MSGRPLHLVRTAARPKTPAAAMLVEPTVGLCDALDYAVKRLAILAKTSALGAERTRLEAYHREVNLLRLELGVRLVRAQRGEA